MKIKAAGELYGRAVEEWVGSSPEAMPPTRVMLRILKRQDGKCARTGIIIRPGKDRIARDHKIPLARGGKNVESNLQIILEAAHIEKTAAENSENAKADRARAKHLGIWPQSKRPLRSRGFSKTRPTYERNDP